MPGELAGKVAIVTGGASNLGAEIARVAKSIIGQTLVVNGGALGDV